MVTNGLIIYIGGCVLQCLPKYSQRWKSGLSINQSFQRWHFDHAFNSIVGSSTWWSRKINKYTTLSSNQEFSTEDSWWRYHRHLKLQANLCPWDIKHKQKDTYTLAPWPAQTLGVQTLLSVEKPCVTYSGPFIYAVLPYPWFPSHIFNPTSNHAVL